MLDSILLYAALAIAFAGLISTVVPLRFPGLRTRRAGAIVLVAGVAAAMAVMALPVSLKQSNARQTMLDLVTPQWQFAEQHIIVVDAPAAATMRAVRAVRPDEILFFRTLTAIRRGGRRLKPSILNAPAGAPLLDIALRSGFFLVAEQPEREIVVGTVIAAPRSARQPRHFQVRPFFSNPPHGFVVATMNFAVTPAGPSRSILTTETRVFSRDPSLVRQFAVYWRIIHPGSDIIRRMWLRAIKVRAEKTAGQRT